MFSCVSGWRVASRAASSVFIFWCSYCPQPAAQEQPDTARYVYPVRPGTPEWVELSGNGTVWQAVQIPDSTLACMSTRVLVQACLDDPNRIAMVMYSGATMGFDQMRRRSHGLAALLLRLDASEALLAKYMEMTATPADTLALAESSWEYGIKMMILEMALAQPQIASRQLASSTPELLSRALAELDKPAPSRLIPRGRLHSILLLMGNVMLARGETSLATRLHEHPSLALFLEGRGWPDQQIYDDITQCAQAVKNGAH